MASTTDAMFKFVLIASIIVLLLLAAVSTMNCQEFKNRIAEENREAFYASYSGIGLNSTISQYWQATPEGRQTQFISKLVNILDGSYPITRVSTALIVTQSDVFMTASDAEAKKNLGITTTSEEDITGIELEAIACPVSTSEYLADDSRHCGAVMQAMSRGHCLVRVFDAYYKVASTCIRVQVDSSGSSLVVNSSHSAAVLAMLNPFALSVSQTTPSKVTGVTITDSNVTFALGSSLTARASGGSSNTPTSVTAYYLDYVKPIMDVNQNSSNTLAIVSLVDTTNGIVGFLSGTTMTSANALTTITSPAFNFLNFTAPTTTTTSTPTITAVPGMVNPARAAVQFGYVYKSETVESKTTNADYLSLNIPKCAYPTGDLNLELNSGSVASCYYDAQL